MAVINSRRNLVIYGDIKDFESFLKTIIAHHKLVFEETNLNKYLKKIFNNLHFHDNPCLECKGLFISVELETIFGT